MLETVFPLSELWLSRLERSPAYECPLSPGGLPAALLFMKSVFVTNSKSWAVEYHNLIMGCHPTAQIHYSQWIYKQHSQHCHPDMTDVLGPDLCRNMIYTCQDSGKNRLQRRLAILSREFLLHGSLDTIIPVLKHGKGEGAALPCSFNYSWI